MKRHEKKQLKYMRVTEGRQRSDRERYKIMMGSRKIKKERERYKRKSTEAERYREKREIERVEGMARQKRI